MLSLQNNIFYKKDRQKDKERQKKTKRRRSTTGKLENIVWNKQVSGTCRGHWCELGLPAHCTTIWHRTVLHCIGERNKRTERHTERHTDRTDRMKKRKNRKTEKQKNRTKERTNERTNERPKERTCDRKKKKERNGRQKGHRKKRTQIWLTATNTDIWLTATMVGDTAHRLHYILLPLTLPLQRILERTSNSNSISNSSSSSNIWRRHWWDGVSSRISVRRTMMSNMAFLPFPKDRLIWSVPVRCWFGEVVRVSGFGFGFGFRFGFRFGFGFGTQQNVKICVLCCDVLCCVNEMNVCWWIDELMNWWIDEWTNLIFAARALGLVSRERRERKGSTTSGLGVERRFVLGSRAPKKERCFNGQRVYVCMHEMRG